MPLLKNDIEINAISTAYVYLISKVQLYSMIFQSPSISTDAKNATKLFVTLRIRNVTLDDDSQYGALGRYECHAYAVNDTHAQKYGFSVSVIRSECCLFSV